jgi:2-polyprenyl-3-methyl-5-hydroxy-6-metoxy-1,4-benzoquinol methylase
MDSPEERSIGTADRQVAPEPPQAVLTGARVIDEHFSPAAELDLEAYIAAGDLTGIHHLARYDWARTILGEPPPKSLLDLGCGCGYGAFILATALPSTKVHGIDYDPQAIAEAMRRYALPNLSFAVGDPTNWDATIGTQTFEVVTSFDVIEHVRHRELFLEGLVRHLEPAGSLLLSTPCGAGRNILQPGWEHHQIEYSAASLFDFLRRYFAAVLRSDEPGFPGREVFEQLHHRGIEYLLRLTPVICREPIRIPNPYTC